MGTQELPLSTMPPGPRCHCYLGFCVSLPLPVFTSKPHLLSTYPFTVWPGAEQKEEGQRGLYSVWPSWSCPGHCPQILREFSSSLLSVSVLIVILKTYFLMYLCTLKNISVPLLTTESSPFPYHDTPVSIHWCMCACEYMPSPTYRWYFAPFPLISVSSLILSLSIPASAFLSLICITFAIQSLI